MKVSENIECSSGGTQIINITNINITLNNADDEGAVKKLLSTIFGQSKKNSDRVITTIEHSKKFEIENET